MRVVSVAFTSIYCAYVLLYTAKHKSAEREIATYYVMATVFATFIGIFIAYGLFVGQLNREDVMPVSVEDVHMAGRIYRFNPGASVNEFGEIIGYAIFMLRWTGWKTTRKMLVAGFLLMAEFLSLTRGAWLGLAVGYSVYALYTRKEHRIRLLAAGGVLFLILMAIVASSDELLYLLLSRTSDFVNTPGGSDRINTAGAVFDAVTTSPTRLLFGYGWAADIFSGDYGFDKIGYIHSVPLMFLFDTGLVGVLFCSVVFYVLGKFVYTHAGKNRDIFAGMIAFMFTVSMVEHIFFHIQSWLIFGLMLGVAFRSQREARTKLAARTLEPQPAR
jgi:hypothetical protein